MGQTDKSLLIEMGFDPVRVDLALKRTGGLQDALTWLESNQDTNIEELEATTRDLTATDPKDSVEASAAEAKSYRCNDCGKLLKNWDAVQFHAERTEHQNFDESIEEIKPLSEEEKKEKLEYLKLKLMEKKKNEAAESVLDAKKNEAIRRKRDQESERAKEELRKKEQLREVERRKQEKIDDARAKAKIKAEIAATQQARRDAAAKAKAERDGNSSLPDPAPPSTNKTALTQTTATEARLRFQFTGTPPITRTFPAEMSLFEVASNIKEETGLTIRTLTTTFPPRKTYNLEEALDSGLSLKEANLAPSAVLIVG